MAKCCRKLFPKPIHKIELKFSLKSICKSGNYNMSHQERKNWESKFWEYGIPRSELYSMSEERFRESCDFILEADGDQAYPGADYDMDTALQQAIQESMMTSNQNNQSVSNQTETNSSETENPGRFKKFFNIFKPKRNENKDDNKPVNDTKCKSNDSQYRNNNNNHTDVNGNNFRQHDYNNNYNDDNNYNHTNANNYNRNNANNNYNNNYDYNNNNYNDDNNYNHNNANNYNHNNANNNYNNNYDYNNNNYNDDNNYNHNNANNYNHNNANNNYNNNYNDDNNNHNRNNHNNYNNANNNYNNNTGKPSNNSNHSNDYNYEYNSSRVITSEQNYEYEEACRIAEEQEIKEAQKLIEKKENEIFEKEINESNYEKIMHDYNSLPPEPEDGVQICFLMPSNKKIFRKFDINHSNELFTFVSAQDELFDENKASIPFKIHKTTGNSIEKNKTLAEQGIVKRTMLRIILDD